MFSAPMSTSRSTDKTLRFVLFILFLACAANVGAADNSLFLVATGVEDLRRHPRQVVSLALSVTNQSSQKRTLVLEPDLPEGWKVLVRESSFDLEPASTDVHIVTFLVPSRALAGKYTCVYRLKDVQDASVGASCRFTLEVLPEAKVDLKLLDSPSFVLGGGEYTATFVLTNTGNVRTLSQWEIKSSPYLLYVVHGLEMASETSLEAGEAKEFTVTVQTDAGLSAPMVHRLRVSGRFHSVGASYVGPSTTSESPPVQVAASVEVVPLSVDRAALFHTLSAVSETTAEMDYGQNSGNSLQEELKASGSLDELGEKRVKLDLLKHVDAGSDRFSNPLDRYSLRYSDKSVDFSVGDLSYSLSPLLADDAFGRGGEATFKFYPWRVGVLYYKDIWSTPGPQGLGETVDFTVPKSGDWDDPLYRVGVNVLSPLTNSLLMGVNQQYSPLPATQLSLDAAVQKSSSGACSPAVLARAEGDLGYVAWSDDFIQAGDGFEGVYSDTQVVRSRTIVRFFDRALALNGGFALSETNLSADETQPSSRALEFTLGADGKIAGSRTNVRFAWERWYYTNKFPTGSDSIRENILRVGLRQPLSFTVLELNSNVGIAQDEASDGSSWNQEHIVFFQFQPSDSFRDGVSARYNGTVDSAGGTSHQLGWGLNAGLGAGNLQIEGNLNCTYFFTQTEFTEFLAAAGAKLMCYFPWRHSLVLQIDHLVSNQSKASVTAGSFILTYIVPFELPIGRKSDTSIVKGRVFDKTTNDSVPGVLLRLEGFAAVTDANGDFIFYLPDSGVKYLQMDTSTIKAKMVPMKPMPLEVAAPQGGTVFVDIGLAEACEVTGTVGVYDFPGRPETFVSPSQAGNAEQEADGRQRLSGLENTILELSDGTEVWRKLTGPGGDFGFAKLRPGKYTLRIVSDNIPSYHSVDPKSFDFELVSGQKKTVEFRVVQEQRTIKILDYQAPVTVEEK